MAELVVAGAKAGTDVTQAVINMPRVGAWTAKLRAAATAEVPSGKVELHLSERLTLVGTVSRAKIQEGILRVQLVAGADGLRKLVKPRHYTNPTIGVVWRDLLGNAGEAPAASADAGVLGTQLPHWTTMQLKASLMLRNLLARAGADVVWRHLPDGAVWTGRETWPEGGVTQFAEVDARPEDATVEVSLLEPDVLPGTMLGDWKVDSLEMRVTGGQVRATIWTA